MPCLFFAAGYCIFAFATFRSEQTQIMKLASAGLEALEGDHIEAAYDLFSKSMERYRNFYRGISTNLWQTNPLLFSTMLRVGQAWRSLGEYQKALEVFQDISLHDSKKPDPIIEKGMKEELVEFIDREHWSDQALNEIYQHLLQIDPKSWGNGDSLLVQLTERAGLSVTPMSERCANAKLIVYGIPEPDEKASDRYFSVRGQNYYLIDRLPGQIRFSRSRFPQQFEKRLNWYLKQGRLCLIFGKNANEEGTEAALTEIEGILLDEPYVIEEFNRIIPE
ncbi:MAG: tetratricopeptide repeat protein [Candidatus Omnitrophota bacterium]|nr:MAG: tetratricopeptide repeat protein [Candidatus Omnitrophota bacterium]